MKKLNRKQQVSIVVGLVLVLIAIGLTNAKAEDTEKSNFVCSVCYKLSLLEKKCDAYYASSYETVKQMVGTAGRDLIQKGVRNLTIECKFPDGIEKDIDANGYEATIVIK